MVDEHLSTPYQLPSGGGD
ncbi:hypothetical protein M6B38_377420 [Iris pallida]|uniref:Uncharacterized protein n=1 Tax=Iris pallida TaxID=29817 RepID=A0AAX6EP28_IRIPA|nr:hypothetical protein M6B38_181230 [Iris pallida]KAJ6825649.1 hypothetical protein M6B38_377420 [Iris pallida]